MEQLNQESAFRPNPGLEQLRMISEKELASKKIEAANAIALMQQQAALQSGYQGQPLIPPHQQTPVTAAQGLT